MIRYHFTCEKYHAYVIFTVASRKILFFFFFFLLCLHSRPDLCPLRFGKLPDIIGRRKKRCLLLKNCDYQINETIKMDQSDFMNNNIELSDTDLDDEDLFNVVKPSCPMQLKLSLQSLLCSK